MAKQMEELSTVCMEEWAIIQAAREALETELDALWKDIEESIKDDIETMPIKMPIRQNDSSPGHYLTQATYKKKDGDLPRITISVRDPRVTERVASYEVRLFWAGRKQYFKNHPKAEERLDELAKEAEVSLSPPGDSIACREFIPVKPKDLDETISAVGKTIISYYRIATEFLKELPAEEKA